MLDHHASWMGRGVVGRVLHEPPNVISVDVVLNALPHEFPGYRNVSLAYWHDDVLGEVGPLAEGHYTFHVVARRYGVPASFQPVCAPQTTSLTVTAAAAPLSVLPVVEYYHRALDHYFITQDADEIAAIDAGIVRGWQRTGHAFAAYAHGGSGGRGRPVCRFYGTPAAGLDTHFFSASIMECQSVEALDPYDLSWIRETRHAFEIALPDLPTGACAAGTTPVYRLWNNRRDSNHRYTTDPAIRQQMIARGWIPEGFGADNVAMCAPVRHPD